MAPTGKPKLPQLTTPTSATFPSDAVLSAKTPLSAKPLSSCCDISSASAKTPISPPTAYTDFLKYMSLDSPAMSPSRQSSSPLSVNGPTSASDSVPSTATSEQTDCSCKCEGDEEDEGEDGKQHRHRHQHQHQHQHRPKNLRPTKGPATAPPVPPSPFNQLPMSAPPNSADSFPSMKIPPSPAFSASVDSPRSARTPFGSRSVQSVFDWDAAIKARFSSAVEKKKKNPRTNVRHIREVVTRTVTYSPTTTRINPAPKGKRRKIEHATSA